MKLIAISRVKDELDIIEPFVRHHAHHFDTHIVLDDGSSDGTYEVLQKLKLCGLPLVVIRQPSVGYVQHQYMTSLLRLAVREFGADWVMPLDADEFLETSNQTSLADVLCSRDPDLFTIPWNNFVWSPDQDEKKEPNPVVRMRLRLTASPARLGKVLIPTKWSVDQLELSQGNHGLTKDGQDLSMKRLDGAQLCHFPIRTMSQYTSKITVGYLQYAALPNWDRISGFHYIEPFRLLKEAPDQFYRTLPEQSRRYSLADTDPDPGQARDDPLCYLGGKLRFNSEPSPALSNVLEYAETLARKLLDTSWEFESLQRTLVRAGGIAGDLASRVVASSAAATFAIRDVPPPRKTSDLRLNSNVVEPSVKQTRFQSFWAGGPLSPYELVCLNSFIACGHAFDLYTFDLNLATPVSVEVRDARELFSPEDFFVYQEGFGKGSPAAFSNLFRYKLLAQKGGWWVDTDVICLSRDVPSFSEFFAREDPSLINQAVLFFEAEHPLMVRCFEEAIKLGRAVHWGDTGPRLFTRILKEYNREDDALERSICYPVHYSEALDVLCPSKLRSVGERMKYSLFIHLWNEMLRHHGIQKTNLPPKGSILRYWAEQNSVGGWVKEYDAEELEVMRLVHAHLGDSDAERVRLWGKLQPRSADRELQDGLRREIERLRAGEKKLLGSTSWRFTGPARAISQRLRALVGARR
jgi:Glycosyl transferase family 2/Alpha 1,4-glycosyltransferase conserved region/Glycosyltransferase sugar-binding region containing DXD motif